MENLAFNKKPCFSPGDLCESTFDSDDDYFVGEAPRVEIKDGMPKFLCEDGYVSYFPIPQSITVLIVMLWPFEESFIVAGSRMSRHVVLYQETLILVYDEGLRKIQSDD